MAEELRKRSACIFVYGLILGKKMFNAEQSRRWAAMIKEIRADGTLQRLIARYVGEDEASRMLAQAL